MTTTAVDDWRDLAQRTGGGLTVTLLWSRCRNQVKVTVTDHDTDAEFEFGVSRAQALSAFHHPFTFAADPSVPTRVRAHSRAN